MAVPKAGDTLLLREADASVWEPLLRLEGRVVARTPQGEVLVDGVPRFEPGCITRGSSFPGFLSDCMYDGSASST